ncbi:MAG: hypothetical protein NTW52_04470 [Planctomycetota bacterium]|nr:hypothetical protein [Planctomycetota bacterium]
MAAFSHHEARKIIIDGSGNHFDPEIVRVFIDCEDEFDVIRAKLADEVPVVTPMK